MSEHATETDQPMQSGAVQPPEGGLPQQQAQAPAAQQMSVIAQRLVEAFNITPEQAAQLEQVLPAMCQVLQSAQQEPPAEPSPTELQPQPAIGGRGQFPTLECKDQFAPMPGEEYPGVLPMGEDFDPDDLVVALIYQGVPEEEAMAMVLEMMQQAAYEMELEETEGLDSTTENDRWLGSLIQRYLPSVLSNMAEQPGFAQPQFAQPAPSMWDYARSLRAAQRTGLGLAQRTPELGRAAAQRAFGRAEPMAETLAREVPAHFRKVRFPWLNSVDCKDMVSDSIVLDMIEDSIQVRDGVLHGHAVATANMVQDYKGKSVLKDAAELEKACKYARSLPITDQHPDDGIVTNQGDIKGWTSPPVWNGDKRHIEVDVEIFDGKLISKIQGGNTDVSIGFFCDLDETTGEFDGKKYAAIQRNIVLNHLAAGLKKGNGRCPDGVCGIKIEDTKTEIEPDGDCEFCGPSAIDTKPYEHLPCVGDSHYDWLMKDAAVSDKRLTAEGRKALPDSVFCGPGRSFPVPDCDHYTAALRMLPRYEGPGDRNKIRACIIGKGRKLDCPGANEMDVNVWDPTQDAAILKRAIESGAGKNTTAVAAGEYRLLPGMPDTHDHTATLDKDGNGTSSETDNHRHEIKEMVVQLTEGHDHQLVPAENTEDKQMNEAEVKKDTAPKQEATDAGAGGATATGTESGAAPQPETDEAAKLVARERTRLVDAIMDADPPKAREHYEKKTIDELEEIRALLSTRKDSTIPSGSSGARKAIDDAYSALEEKLRR